ncbi:unnamed protein product, partial [Allacma fusca]
MVPSVKTLHYSEIQLPDQSIRPYSVQTKK